ncbi:hypothetical protein VTP01DRAFT_10569 [Rhizomucor pusillus]|uniref:uncharacterized protein n=1 Tax=Rhizomucor pusillus TaxID=4840 RepID=UPI003742DEA5
MPRRCCCIIPLRAASLIISILLTGVSVLLLGLTFTKYNPMVMHLAVIHSFLPWIAVIFYAATAVIGLYGILASAVGKLPLMRLYKTLFWVVLVFLLTVWEGVDFVLALVNRSKSQSACEEANPGQEQSGSGDQSISVGGYTTTFLGMQLGNTYGLANCSQAVQAGVIGIAILLFIGQLAMTYFATVVSSYTTKLREFKHGHRLRDDEWNDNLDDLAAAYREDARTAANYRMNNFSNKKKGGNKFAKGLKSFKIGK